MTTNYNIKVPDQHYVTFQAYKDDALPLGFMTPYGTDAAAEKRMATADSWAGGGYWSQVDSKFEPRIIDNEPMSGFVIAKNVSRFSTSNVLWRIKDPRGFELEIFSGNMFDLLQLTTIEEGEILAPCIWARHGANNVLLVEHDPEYQQAKANSQRVKKKVGMRDVKPGNTVILHNGTKGRYMGSFNLIELTYGDSSDNDDDEDNARSRVRVRKNAKHYFHVLGNNNKFHDCNRYMGISSPKISEIVDASEEAIVDTEQEINENYSLLTCSIADGTGGSEYRAIGVVARTKETTNMEVDLIELDNPKEFLAERKKMADINDIYRSGTHLFAKHDERWIECGNGFSKNDSVIGNVFDLDLFKDTLVFHHGVLRYNEHRATSRWNADKNEVTASVDDAIWYLPSITFISPVTQNKFSMLMP